MIVFPHCKINLGLHITAKRTDGYHDLETVFYPVPLTDLLEVINRDSGTDCLLEQTGLSVAGTPEQNLCIKAYRLLKNDFPWLPPINIYLHKQIPSGAGLGGGSADGAFMLQLLVDRFSLPVNKSELLRYALLLGSDCPFFIMKEPVLAYGRGEQMRPVSVDLTGYYLALVLPGLHISTKEAFENCAPRTPAVPLENSIRQPISTWRDTMTNQFEETVFLRYPQLADYKQLLYRQGAVYASMSGTGSTIFGLFAKAPDATQLREKCGCTIRILPV